MAAGSAVAIRVRQVRRLEVQRALDSAAARRAVLGGCHLGKVRRRAEGHPAGHFRTWEIPGAGAPAGEEALEEARPVHHIAAAAAHQGYQDHLDQTG